MLESERKRNHQWHVHREAWADRNNIHVSCLANNVYLLHNSWYIIYTWQQIKNMWDIPSEKWHSIFFHSIDSCVSYGAAGALDSYERWAGITQTEFPVTQTLTTWKATTCPDVSLNVNETSDAVQTWLFEHVSLPMGCHNATNRIVVTERMTTIFEW